MAAEKKGALRWIAWPVTEAARLTYRSANPDAILAGAQDIAALWKLVRTPGAGVARAVARRDALWRTASATRAYLCGAVATLGFWTWQALSAPAGIILILSGIGTLLIAALLCARAFGEAMQHWRIRSGQPGSARDFLASPGPIWPRYPR